jgi:hypothetical protein
VRQACRDEFRNKRLLERILPDIDELLCIGIEERGRWTDLDSDPALPEALWEGQHYKEWE